jgi:hypothetical protein
VRKSISLWLGFGAMCVGMFMAVLDVQVVASSLTDIGTALAIPVPSENLIWGFCGRKQNRTIIKSDGRPRKPSVGIYLELLPIA